MCVCVFFFNAVNKTADISVDYINLTPKTHHDVKPELIHRHTNFHLDQVRGVQGTEIKRFCFALTL